jgi:26S proteasome regulatory subunit T1
LVIALKSKQEALLIRSVVNLGDRVSPTDIEEGMRVGVDRQKYSIQLPLPPKIDPSVTMMQVEEKPDVTYSDVGGCKEQIERLREVVEVPLLSVYIPRPCGRKANIVA